jgi:hypothetical protein
MPRLKARGEVFEILYEYKHHGMDIGDAYDQIYDEITRSYGGTRSLGNSKKPRFKFANGKLKLKKMGIAFRKSPAGRKKKR